MSEYIDRDATLNERPGGRNPGQVGKEEYNKGWNDCRSAFYKCITSMPAADVAEVVHGKWEPGNPICPVCGENKFKDLDADVWADWQPKFCPNCGARMDKEADHD